MNLKSNALPWLGLSAAVVLLDQIIKQWVLTRLPEYQPVAVIDGFWNWYRSYNTGAAFSFLSDAGGWQQYLFIGLALVISGLMAKWLSQTRRDDWRTALPFALVIGGALANVTDRLRHGYVVDYIQWYWREWYWPTFNLSDIAIVAGAIGIALFGMLQDKSAKPAP